MSYNTISAKSIRFLHATVMVTDLDRGPRKSAAGLIIPDDNATTQGIHPRWGKVYAVGPEIDDVVPGEWVLIEHGRWTVGIQLELDGKDVRVWKIDPDAILIVSTNDPRTYLVTKL